MEASAPTYTEIEELKNYHMAEDMHQEHLAVER